MTSVGALACATINVSELDAIAPSRALFSSGDTLSANLIPDYATVSTSAGGGVAHAAKPRIAAVTAMDAFPGFPIMSITPLDFGMSGRRRPTPENAPTAHGPRSAREPT
jgi:hypothetical protein